LLEASQEDLKHGAFLSGKNGGGGVIRETFEVKKYADMGFSAAKRRFWARKDQIRTRTLANLPSNQYIDIFPNARQTGFQQQITETFPVTGMRSPVRSIWKTSVLPCSS